MKRKGITYTRRLSSLWGSVPFVIVMTVICLPILLTREGNTVMQSIALLAVVIIGLYLVSNLYYIFAQIRVTRRQKRFDLYAQSLATGTGVSKLEVPAGAFQAASFNQLGSPEAKDVRNRRYMNGLQGQGWIYADYAYDIYAHAKNSTYLYSTNYYSVLCMTLPRVVPNVLFDSVRSRGRQFRTMFAGDQVHDMEGDFSKFFTVYIPYGYTIDAYSFISPEVMWAMREAADYDIEIVGDKLYLMGPMGEPDSVVQDMQAKASEIYRKLADNLETYRDERLPYADGRKEVAAVGARLYESNTKLLVAFLSTLGIGMLNAVVLVRSERQFWILETVVVVGITGLFGYRLYKSVRKKQRLKRQGYYATRKPMFRRTSSTTRRPGA